MRWPENSLKTKPDKVCSGSVTVPNLPHCIVSGGSLGWKVRGSLHGDFEKVAYELEPSTTSNPKYAEVKTSHGYHIIMVEGRK